MLTAYSVDNEQQKSMAYNNEVVARLNSIHNFNGLEWSAEFISPLTDVFVIQILTDALSQQVTRTSLICFTAFILFLNARLHSMLFFQFVVTYSCIICQALQ